MSKNPSKCGQRYFVMPKSSFLSAFPPALLLHDFADRIASELWWMNQEFPCQYHSTMVLSMLITRGINNRPVEIPNRPVGGRSSEM
jgi:hypothetical protein